MKAFEEVNEILSGSIGIGDIWHGNIRMIIRAEYLYSLLCKKRAEKETLNMRCLLTEKVKKSLRDAFLGELNKNTGDEEKTKERLEKVLRNELYCLGYDLKRAEIHIEAAGD